MPADHTPAESHQPAYQSAQFFPIKNKPALLGIITFAILASLIATLVYQRFLIRHESKKNEARHVLNAVKEKLQELLAQSESATKTLSFFIQPDGSVKDFELVASQILKANPELDALELVPGGVIRHVYPLKGNELALGYDILHDPSRNKEAMKAIRRKELFFAGPLALKQGGVAVVGRLPVFRNKKFWGFSAVIIKMPTFLKASGIELTGRIGYYFQLSKINPDTRQEEFFIPQPNELRFNNFISVDIPNGDWKLSAIPVDDKKGYVDVLWLAVLGLLFSIMGGGFVFIVAQKPEKLDNLVKLRTAALQTSEQKYHSLIEQASDGIIISDLSGIIIEANKRICEMGGFNIEEMTGRHIHEFMPKEDITEQPLRLEDLLKGKTLLYERRMLKKDGTFIEVEVNSKMANGNSLIGFVRDISERKKAEKELKKSNERFELTAKATNDAIWDHDFITDTTTGNDNLYNLYGFKNGADKISFDMFMANIHPGDKERILQNLDKAIHAQSAFVTEEFRFKTASGTYHNFYDRAYIKYDDVGKATRILGVMQDITSRIKGEEAILKEKELSDSIINSLPAVFYLYDKNGKFIRWNKNFEMLTGYRADEIRQMHSLDFFDENEKRLVDGGGEADFLQRSPGVELLLVAKDGKKIPFYLNSLAIEYQGSPCIMGMGFDVTDRKKIEQELLVSNQRLEQKAAELRASYTELERFAYIVSHDLQEPLRMVSSFLKLLEQKYKAHLDETAEKYIHFAVDGAERMKHLIMDLLEYSRTGANKDIAANTDMNEVMADVLKVLENSIQEQQAVVEIGLLPVLHGTSKLQMFQLMQNLLGNSLKYHGKKVPLIKISAKEENDKWLFSVKDNGIGIDPKFSEKIFIIFQRLHNKNEFSGTGIGLSICKKIVEKHGGKIWVESNLGNGSEFFFSIPKKDGYPPTW